jgi:type IV pilus assembly protein PilF
MNAGRCSLALGDRARAEAYFRRALSHEPALVPAHAELARLAFERGDYAAARVPMLAVLGSGQAAAEDYAIAVRIERKLGDRAAEQSLVSQWQRRFPDSPQLQTYQRGETNDQ